MLVARRRGVAMSFYEDRQVNTSQVEDLRGEIDRGGMSRQI
jgi:hypothetical protein